MVCVPCIVIPFVLWFFHKYIRPIIVKVWPWSKQEVVDDGKTKQNGVTLTADSTKTDGVSESNGVVSNGHTVTAGGEDKKNK